MELEIGQISHGIYNRVVVYIYVNSYVNPEIAQSRNKGTDITVLRHASNMFWKKCSDLMQAQCLYYSLKQLFPFSMPIEKFSDIIYFIIEFIAQSVTKIEGN